MNSTQIRQAFLDFFKNKGHLIVPSAPIVAKNDPTLMFNNSGMSQFKDYFLGNALPPAPRIADTQKCLRVSGKHNDLEDVGFDTYHHTMFEMLGNWSFGDYFKKEAIAWAWELLTEVYKLPKDRIYVSVFEGDKADGVALDQEAWDYWAPIVGEDRILVGNKKDNFWEMGEIGPCGPCSEIHLDLREEKERSKISGKDLVNKDHPQVVEIWNLVFMQYERKANGTLAPLPARHVDTGMGFERLCMAVQNKKSNYDTDVFSGTLSSLEKLSGKKYVSEFESDTIANQEQRMVNVAMRVIADHIRAVSFAIADGQLPSNVRAGYVIRRILRRAVRYGYSYLGFRGPFFHRLVPLIAAQFQNVFPELRRQEDFVTNIVLEEEKSFLRTLEAGLKRLDQLFLANENTGTISGKDAFELSDTFGFPLDLTALIAKENDMKVDVEGFQKALDQQKHRSRNDAVRTTSDWVELRVSDGVDFVGYDQDETLSQVTKYRKVKTKDGEVYHIVLDRTPFYAEMGGQVGDSGTLLLSIDERQAEKLVQIVDTKKENDLFIHISKDKDLDGALKKSGSVRARIDTVRREKIKANHTATHLMLAAMKQVLGNHVSQKGSFLNDEVLRFDFSHFSKLSLEELRKIEDVVNEKIRADIPLSERRNVPIKTALKEGATATFGEKYGDYVRVITIDPDFSVELCGGTHMASSGKIGLFKFISEGSVSAGVRRVEALTGARAIEVIRRQEDTFSELRELVKGQTDLVKGVKSLMEEKSSLQKKLEEIENRKIAQVKSELLGKIQEVNGVNRLIEKIDDASPELLKQLAYLLREQIPNLFLVLGSEINGKPHLVVLLSENIVKNKSLDAGKVVRELAKEIKGGGGGQPFFATAGGSDPKGLGNALKKAHEVVLKST